MTLTRTLAYHCALLPNCYCYFAGFCLDSLVFGSCCVCRCVPGRGLSVAPVRTFNLVAKQVRLLAQISCLFRSVRLVFAGGLSAVKAVYRGNKNSPCHDPKPFEPAILNPAIIKVPITRPSNCQDMILEPHFFVWSTIASSKELIHVCTNVLTHETEKTDTSLCM